MPGATLVTGASGFAGSHLLDLLAAEGTHLVAWHRPGTHPPIGSPATTWQAVDLLDAPSVRRAIESVRPGVVYHCAGAAHVGRSWGATEATFAVNVRGTHHLLEALRAAGLEVRVMIPGSAMVYRPMAEALTEDHPLVPPSPYGLSKLAQELLGVRASTDRIAVTIGRAFNHVGPRQDPAFAASGFAKQIAEIEAGRREPEVVVGNLDARRDTLDVRDTVRAYRSILTRGQAGRPYNVSSGKAVAIAELLEMLVALARVPVRVRVDPDRFRPNDVPLLLGDSSRIRRELGWAPTIPLSQTLDDLLAYWRASSEASPAGLLPSQRHQRLDA
ncbi:MAG: GDP-mannose 4,6-dehydratase [Vicinamibacterales bacterium]|nr:GDP-mannose 4,6-dehydratase [Vicinamibacterales bacterium]